MTRRKRDTQPPSEFHAFIGGYTGPSFSVEWDGSVLLYRATGSQYELECEAEIRPAPERWASFERALERAGFWNWLPEYPDPGIVDGTSWEIEISWGDRRKAVQGSNAYPGKDAESVDPEPSARFRQFLAAVRKLAGANFR